MLIVHYIQLFDTQILKSCCENFINILANDEFDSNYPKIYAQTYIEMVNNEIVQHVNHLGNDP